jgi:hypothetical protein
MSGRRGKKRNRYKLELTNTKKDFMLFFSPDSRLSPREHVPVDMKNGTLNFPESTRALNFGSVLPSNGSAPQTRT